jgi:hypothetical protein
VESSMNRIKLLTCETETCRTIDVQEVEGF